MCTLRKKEQLDRQSRRSPEGTLYLLNELRVSVTISCVDIVTKSQSLNQLTTYHYNYIIRSFD